MATKTAEKKTPQKDGYVPRLKERYESELRAALKDELGLSTIMQVPRISKITLNMGVARSRSSRSSPASARNCAAPGRQSPASRSAPACRSARA
jgi:hypothetical protein